MSTNFKDDRSEKKKRRNKKCSSYVSVNTQEKGTKT